MFEQEIVVFTTREHNFVVLIKERFPSFTQKDQRWERKSP